MRINKSDVATIILTILGILFVGCLLAAVSGCKPILIQGPTTLVEDLDANKGDIVGDDITIDYDGVTIQDGTGDLYYTTAITTTTPRDFHFMKITGANSETYYVEVNKEEEFWDKPTKEEIIFTVVDGGTGLSIDDKEMDSDLKLYIKKLEEKLEQLGKELHILRYGKNNE